MVCPGKYASSGGRCAHLDKLDHYEEGGAGQDRGVDLPLRRLSGLPPRARDYEQASSSPAKTGIGGTLWIGTASFCLMRSLRRYFRAAQHARDVKNEIVADWPCSRTAKDMCWIRSSCIWLSPRQTTDAKSSNLGSSDTAARCAVMGVCVVFILYTNREILTFHRMSEFVPRWLKMAENGLKCPDLAEFGRLFRN